MSKPFNLKRERQVVDHARRNDCDMSHTKVLDYLNEIERLRDMQMALKMERKALKIQVRCLELENCRLRSQLKERQ